MRERPGQGDLDRARRCWRAGTRRRAPRPGAGAGSGRRCAAPGLGLPAAPGDRRRVVDVDAVERGGEAVRVALAAHLAVGDDVDAGALHVADREQRRVVLRLLEPGFAARARSPARARAAPWSSASRDRSASRAADSCRRPWSAGCDASIATASVTGAGRRSVGSALSAVAANLPVIPRGSRPRG